MYSSYSKKSQLTKTPFPSKPSASDALLVNRNFLSAIKTFRTCSDDKILLERTGPQEKLELEGDHPSPSHQHSPGYA